MESLLIKNGRIWDGDKFFFGDVLVEKKIITQIAPAIHCAPDFVFDAKGCIVSPGLVDAHMHMRGISSDELGVDVQMGCIPFGVTSAADASGGFGDEERMNSFFVKSKVFVGIDPDCTERDFKNVEELLIRYGKCVAGIKTYLDAGISNSKDLKCFETIIDFACQKGLSVMVHASNPPVPMADIFKSLRTGDILTHAYHGGKNNVSVDGFRSLMEAQSRGIIIDVGFAGNVHINYQIFADAISCGALPDSISTDLTRFSSYKRGGRYGMTMCMSIAKQLGMNEADIFKAVTQTPAKVLGINCGRLEVGMNADISVFSFTEEPFDLTDKAGNRVSGNLGYSCVMTVIDGEIAYIK